MIMSIKKINLKNIFIGLLIVSFLFISGKFSSSIAEDMKLQQGEIVKNQKQGLYRVGNSTGYFFHTIANGILPDGNVLLASNHGEIFDTKTNKFKSISPLNIYMDAKQIYRLDDGNMLIITPKILDPQVNILNMFQIYNLKNKTIQTVLERYNFEKKGQKPFHYANSIKLKDGNIFIYSCGKEKEFYIFDTKNYKLSEPIKMVDKTLSYRLSCAHSSCIDTKSDKVGLIEKEDGNILIFGMGLGDKDGKKDEFNYVFEYNRDLNNFKIVGQLVESRFDKIYAHKLDKNNVIVIGGIRFGYGSGFTPETVIKSVEKYNITTGKSEIIGYLDRGVGFMTIPLFIDNKGIFFTGGAYFDYKTYKMQKLNGFEKIGPNSLNPVLLEDGSILYYGGSERMVHSNKSYRYYF